jgi:hypothetical protein
VSERIGDFGVGAVVGTAREVVAVFVVVRAGATGFEIVGLNWWWL